MQDMLVRLLQLPTISETEEELLLEGIRFRRPIGPERHLLVNWVQEHFSDYWASETKIAFSRKPVSCFIAHRNNDILGFACYETTAPNFFGPTGTLETERGKGIGRVLLVKALEALREMGYAYAIIGGVGPAAYYEKVVGAQIIQGSEKNIYEYLIRKK